MILTICMAGFNTRFHDAGFDIPKYLLQWGNQTVIHEILKRLTTDYTFEQIILMANKRDIYFKPQLTIATAEFSPTISYIGDTIGQAHTAAIAARTITTDIPFLIHNADTVLVDRNLTDINNAMLSNDAYIDVFTATSPEYCYITADKNKVTNISEKNTISTFASSGLYGFKNAAVYLENYEKTLLNYTNKEVYISDVLSNMLQNNMNIEINDITTNQSTIVIGSPKEYSMALRKALTDDNN